MAQLFTDNAQSLLAADITSGALSLTVTAGHGDKFPAPTGDDYFMLTLASVSNGAEVAWEIVKVTARSVDTLTIVRAQEGTSAVGWTAGDSLGLRVTAQFANDTATKFQGVEFDTTGVTTTTTLVVPDKPNATVATVDNALGDNTPLVVFAFGQSNHQGFTTTPLTAAWPTGDFRANPGNRIKEWSTTDFTIITPNAGYEAMDTAGTVANNTFSWQVMDQARAKNYTPLASNTYEELISVGFRCDGMANTAYSALVDIAEANPTKDIYVIAIGKGGSRLTTDWQPDNDGGSINARDAVDLHIPLALAQLETDLGMTAGTARIDLCIMQLGSSDANHATATPVSVNPIDFKDSFLQFKSDFETAGAIRTSPSVPLLDERTARWVLMDVTPYYGEHWSGMTALNQATNGRVTVLPAKGYLLKVEGTTGNADGIHYDGFGLNQMGIDIADSLLNPASNKTTAGSGFLANHLHADTGVLPDTTDNRGLGYAKGFLWSDGLDVHMSVDDGGVDTSGFAVISHPNPAKWSKIAFYDDQTDATATGHVFDTKIAKTTGNLLELQNLGTTEFTIDSSGDIVADYMNTGGGIVNEVLFSRAATFDNSVGIRTNVSLFRDTYGTAADGVIKGVFLDPIDANSVSTVLTTSTNLGTAGSKLLSVQNNDVEKAYVDKDGYVGTAGIIIPDGTQPLVEFGTPTSHAIGWNSKELVLNIGPPAASNTAVYTANLANFMSGWVCAVGEGVYFAASMPQDFLEGGDYYFMVTGFIFGTQVFTIDWNVAQIFMAQDGDTVDFANANIVAQWTPTGTTSQRLSGYTPVQNKATVGPQSIVTGAFRRLANGTTENTGTVYLTNASLVYQSTGRPTKNYASPYDA